MLTDAVFWSEALWLAPPASWRPTIVSFRGYGTGGAEGRALWDAVTERMAARASEAEAAAR